MLMLSRPLIRLIEPEDSLRGRALKAWINSNDDLKTYRALEPPFIQSGLEINLRKGKARVNNILTVGIYLFVKPNRNQTPIYFHFLIETKAQ